MTILLLAYYVQPLLFFLGKIHFYQYLFAVSVLFCFVLICFVLFYFVLFCLFVVDDVVVVVFDDDDDDFWVYFCVLNG